MRGSSPPPCIFCCDRLLFIIFTHRGECLLLEHLRALHHGGERQRLSRTLLLHVLYFTNIAFLYRYNLPPSFLLDCFFCFAFVVHSFAWFTLLRFLHKWGSTFAPYTYNVLITHTTRPSLSTPAFFIIIRVSILYFALLHCLSHSFVLSRLPSVRFL